MIWFDIQYPYRRKIKLKGSTFAAGDHFNFPLPLDMTAAGASFFARLEREGKGICFVTDDGTHEKVRPSDLVQFFQDPTTGKTVFYLNAERINGAADTTVFIYYGADREIIPSNNPATFPGHDLASHLSGATGQNGQIPGILNTVNRVAALVTGNQTKEAAPVNAGAKAPALTTSEDGIYFPDCGNDSNPNTSNEIEFSFWGKALLDRNQSAAPYFGRGFVVTPNGRYSIFNSETPGFKSPRVQVRKWSNITKEPLVDQTPLLYDGDYHHIVAQTSAGVVKIFIDGGEIEMNDYNPFTDNIDTTDNPKVLGIIGGSLDGSVSEVRLKIGNSTSQEIQTTYSAESDAAAVWEWDGAEEAISDIFNVTNRIDHRIMSQITEGQLTLRIVGPLTTAETDVFTLSTANIPEAITNYFPLAAVIERAIQPTSGPKVEIAADVSPGISYANQTRPFVEIPSQMFTKGKGYAVAQPFHLTQEMSVPNGEPLTLRISEAATGFTPADAMFLLIATDSKISS